MTQPQLKPTLEEAIEAARWLLPFLFNEPRHLQAALHKWPWLYPYTELQAPLKQDHPGGDR